MATAEATFDLLSGHSMINLTTYRKNGDPVSTPVTFCRLDGKLYVITGKTSWKIKRLQRNAEVQLTPCDWNGNALGSTMTGKARIVSDAEGKMLGSHIKFPVPSPMMFIFNRMRDLRQGGNVYVEICLI